jgi:dUTP pyrophosphatase
MAARPGDAGLDLVGVEDLKLSPGGGRGLVRTGLEIALPEGVAGLVLARSGLAARHGVTCLNSPGLIDPGYRGEIKVILVNTDPDNPYLVRAGDRVAQLLIVAVSSLNWVASLGPLPDTERGSGGFGHTGR